MKQIDLEVKMYGERKRKKERQRLREKGFELYSHNYFLDLSQLLWKNIFSATKPSAEKKQKDQPSLLVSQIQIKNMIFF